MLRGWKNGSAGKRLCCSSGGLGISTGYPSHVLHPNCSSDSRGPKPSSGLHALTRMYTHTRTNLKLELKVKTRFMYKTKQFSEKDWKPVPPGHHVSIVQCLRKACVPIQKRQVLYSYPTEVMSLLAQSFGPHTYLNSLTPSHSIFHSNFFSLRQSPYALLANLIT